MRRKRAAYNLILLFSVVVGVIVLGLSTGGSARYLKMITISEDEIPTNGFFDIVYILGGAQPSLQKKIARLKTLSRRIGYHKILIPDRPGITEYSGMTVSYTHLRAHET